ncbi:MAG: class I SAM-dependent RNA methyltransferase [Parvularculaceae bacterium]|nr:class I SAM-dependent RNA methyltransferase [Parvularculaceae bacterium]
MARPNRHRAKRSAPPRRLTVRIEEIAAGGDGVALVDGARVFVPLTAPGDVAEIEARGERGTLIGVMTPGPDRAEPSCRHYGRCGGCALQHVDADFYRAWKRGRVVSALAREGFGADLVAALIETPAASRRRAAFAVTKRGGRTLIGFNARRSSDIVDLEDCRILHPDLLARLDPVRSLASTISADRFDLSLTLCDNGVDAAIAGDAVTEPVGAALSAVISAMRAAGIVRLSLNGETIAAIASPLVHFDGVPVSPPPGGFLQASREGEAALISLVRAAAGKARKIADLFAGCGTFALPLAKIATVTAVDGDRASIEALATAAAAAQGAGMKINPVKTEMRDLFERPLTVKELKGFDAIVFDPPRAGALMQATEIARSRAPVVIGVSCNPVSFARDAAVLRDGGYELTEVTPVDQFVYSSHVELVGVFRR